MNARDLLVEIGTEELPPKALRELEESFAHGLRSGLDAAGLEFSALESYATPRRLAALVRALATTQRTQQIRRKGPPVAAAFDAAGNPTRAAAAFAASCGVAPDKLERLKDGKGEFLYHVGTRPGAAAADLLPGIVQSALDALPIPKRMRWGAGEAQFVRPVHWLVLMHGSEIVPAQLLDIKAGNCSRGHRFHAPQALPIDEPAHYADLLRTKGWVVASFDERRELVRSQVDAAARQLGGRAIVSDALLDEVCALVEWPIAIVGQFEARFLELPREVLISTLQDHQRYFAVESAAGELLPWFITAANIESRDPSRVRAGNERVVRPRLTDAAYFFEQDRRVPLSSRRAMLDKVSFQAQLGSIGDKTERLRAIAREIGRELGADAALVDQAATLCKCDLVTAMVGEFPELQGIMGRYYARAERLPEEVAVALGEHYLPRGGGDPLPQSRTGSVIALADKLDTLAGIFAIGEKPSGAKDPFGLRRAAIGVLRIILEGRLTLDLAWLADIAVSAQPTRATAHGEVAAEVLAFVLQRLRTICIEQWAHSGEMFDAVLAAGATAPLDIAARLGALARFLARPEAERLTMANKRIANILRKSEVATSADFDERRLRDAAEITLARAIADREPGVRAALGRADYVAALESLAALAPQIDAFFDHVMVNDADAALRANRHALLRRLRELFNGVADLSQLPG